MLQKLYYDIKIKSCFQRKLLGSNRNQYTTSITTSIDDTTKGNWKGRYGSKGYYIIGDRISLPDDVYYKVAKWRKIEGRGERKSVYS